MAFIKPLVKWLTNGRKRLMLDDRGGFENRFRTRHPNNDTDYLEVNYKGIIFTGSGTYSETGTGKTSYDFNPNDINPITVPKFVLGSTLLVWNRQYLRVKDSVSLASGFWEYEETNQTTITPRFSLGTAAKCTLWYYPAP